MVPYRCTFTVHLICWDCNCVSNIFIQAINALQNNYFHNKTRKCLFHSDTAHVWWTLLLKSVATRFVWANIMSHYNDVIMSAIAFQITSLTIVYSTVYSGADQRKHESSASLAFARGIHRWPVNSPHKWPVTRKMFPFDKVIMPHNIHTLFYFLLLISWFRVESGGVHSYIFSSSCSLVYLIKQFALCIMRCSVLWFVDTCVHDIFSTLT